MTCAVAGRRRAGVWGDPRRLRETYSLAVSQSVRFVTKPTWPPLGIPTSAARTTRTAPWSQLSMPSYRPIIEKTSRPNPVAIARASTVTQKVSFSPALFIRRCRSLLILHLASCASSAAELTLRSCMGGAALPCRSLSCWGFVGADRRAIRHKCRKHDRITGTRPKASPFLSRKSRSVTREDRADFSPYRKRAAPSLRRHRASGCVPDR